MFQMCMEYGCKCVFVVGHGDSEAGCGNARAMQLCCTVDGSHHVHGTYLFILYIYTQAPSHSYPSLFFLIITAHFIAMRSQNMDNLPTCNQDCLTTGDLLSCELGDSTCYCQTRRLIIICHCIESECSASDKDIMMLGSLVLAGRWILIVTRSSTEGPRTSSVMKTLEIYGAQPTTLRTSSTATTLATSTERIQASKESDATALLTSSSSSQAQPQSGLATGAKAGIAVRSFSWCINHCGHSHPSRET